MTTSHTTTTTKGQTMPETTETDPTTVVVDLPPTFYDDHEARDLAAGCDELLRRKRYVRVRLTAAAYHELRSDAEHYVADGTYAADYPGLVSSARATLRRLAEVEPPVERAITAACSADRVGLEVLTRGGDDHAPVPAGRVCDAVDCSTPAAHAWFSIR